MIVVVGSKLWWLMEVVGEANVVHDLDNEEPTASFASRCMSNLNDLLSLGILGSWSFEKSRSWVTHYSLYLSSISGFSFR